MEPNETKTFVSDSIKLNARKLCTPPLLTRGGPTIPEPSPIVLFDLFPYNN